MSATGLSKAKLLLLGRGRKQQTDAADTENGTLQLSFLLPVGRQKSDDWKTHAPECEALMSGTWKDITVRLPVDFQLNWYDVPEQQEVHELRRVQRAETAVPENIHSILPFIVKIQLAGVNRPAATGQRELDGQSMLIYDRHRSFEVAAYKRGSETAEFDAVVGVVKAKGDRGLGVFC
ncbi:hypothetical protein DFH09DRAFT_1106059 [Mycena vulgaris]|nr:hypothetical protein DFH09DRAFT_1106059 [Mycena vulgaris]